MKLDFYYFSYQCPLNDDMLRLLEEYRSKIEIHTYDISHAPLLAAEMKIFFPTLTVLNGEKRYYSPLKRAFLEQVLRGNFPEETPFLPQLSEKYIEKQIVPLRLENVDSACTCCGNETGSNCRKKRSFLSAFPQDLYGFLHKDSKGKLIGGAEYLPAECVPYPIPHDKDTAFITCVYLSDSEYDYKSAPLKALEAHLKKEYARCLAISDEAGVFPNGDLRFFLRNGYQDEGLVFEDANYCRLHLMSKPLR